MAQVPCYLVCGHFILVRESFPYLLAHSSNP